MKTLEPLTDKQRKIQSQLNNNKELREQHDSRRVTRHWSQFVKLRKQRSVSNV